MSMGIWVGKGTPSDYEEIVEVADRAFRCDFPALLPKLYRNHPETAAHHQVVKEGGRIKALVGSFPLALQVGETTLKMRGIGTVCVEADARRLGYMRLLMDAAMVEAAAEGCDLAALDGQRQRYEFWGFTPAGLSVHLDFQSMNFRTARYASPDAITFDEVVDASDPRLGEAFLLHDVQAAHAVRSRRDFLDICRSWNASLFLLREEGRFSGYLCASEDRARIVELVPVDPRESDRIVGAYLKRFERNEVSVRCQPHETVRLQELTGLCEGLSIRGSGCFRIMDFPRTLRALLELKSSISPLPDGRLVLEVVEKGRWRVAVEDGRVSVAPADAPPDLVMSHLEATTFLFSHAGYLDAARSAVPMPVRAWFPLPLFFPGQDMV